MNLSTTYLGLSLRTPLVPSASPLTENPDNIKRMEDAGASAIVFHSLFEEQIRAERYELYRHLTEGTESYPEALSYFPEPVDFKIGPDLYLEHIARAKTEVKIPIIASLNGSTQGGWIQYARQIQQAGADALEVNLYSIPTDFETTAQEIEYSYLQVVRDIKAVVTIPVAIKLGPFFTNLGRMAKCLEGGGADGLVLFNRFYQPDIDTETLEMTPHLLLSTPMAMRLPLTWIGILAGRVRVSLAATSGIHRATDVAKMLLVGADVTMLCSVLLRRGISHLRVIEQELCEWMEQHEYESVGQLKGSLSQEKCPDPSAFERALYLYTLTSASEGYVRDSIKKNKDGPSAPREPSLL
ncbi:MAG: dihydroorotate dehydrogenase-like protein [Methylacidiphilales bacterium]|nr:dihydroorotate dehydrogenase-like protein [Candidatus Methylacidiphilales bacterium]